MALGEEHFRQRDQHMKRLWGRSLLKEQQASETGVEGWRVGGSSQ